MSNPIFGYYQFSGKKILVTGASSGIGQETAIILSKLGARIVLVARDITRLEATLTKMDGSGHKVISLDIANEEDLTSLFEEAIEDGEKLNGLVHCAGMSQVLPVRMLTKERLINEMSVNYFSYIELIRQFSKKRFSDGGSIVGISSIAADRPAKGQTNYAASKDAMNVATQALAIELVEKGIRVNTVLPGMVTTEMAKGVSDLGVSLEKIEKQQLLGACAVDDIVNTIVFLLSDLSSKITGRKFFVDGGRLL